MLLNSTEMKALEERAFATGSEPGSLMDEAGAKIAEAVLQFFPRGARGHCIVHFGKGHNGGDALVAAKHLARAGWSLELVGAFPSGVWSPLTACKFAAVELLPPAQPVERQGLPVAVLDGLLGLGGGGALREPVLSAARAINSLRLRHGATVFAIDVPTGLDADTGAADANAVRADFTLAVGFAKRGLLEDGATPFVGRLAVLPLAALVAVREGAGPGTAELSTGATLAPLFPKRGFNVHKGLFGRVTIVAGSLGFAGAAQMAAAAAVRAGAGLVSLCVSPEIYDVVASGAASEVMVKPVKSFREVLGMRHDAVGLGPGLGSPRRMEILELIKRLPVPVVVDAYALTALATDLSILDRCAGPRLLTPHLGEMKRLDGASAGRSRRETVQAFTGRFEHVLLLKGARTVVGQRGKPMSFNTTGSPGMASGGMGDVLTGVCAALAGQGLSLYDAARLGAWVCGRAAELAIHQGDASEESFCATDLLSHLGLAFKALRLGSY